MKSQFRNQDATWLRGRWEWLCHSQGAGAAAFGRLELFVGSLGWSKANKERKCVGEDGAVPPTGNPGLRHWLDCVAVGITLLDPVAEHGPAAAQSNSNALSPALGRGAK